MKLQQKIVLGSFIVALLLTILFFILSGPNRPSEVILIFGMVAFWGGLIELIVGLILLVLEDKRISQGLLISAGLLIVIGFITCTGSFSVH